MPPTQVKTLSAAINKRLTGLSPNMGMGAFKPWPGEGQAASITSEVEVIDFIVDREAKFKYTEPVKGSKEGRPVELDALSLHFIFREFPEGGNENGITYNDDGRDKITIPYIDPSKLPKGTKNSKGREQGNQQARYDREVARFMGAFQGLMGYELDDVENGISLIADFIDQAKTDQTPIFVKLLKKFGKREWTRDDGSKAGWETAQGFIQELISGPGTVAAEGEEATEEQEEETVEEVQEETQEAAEPEEVEEKVAARQPARKPAAKPAAKKPAARRGR